MGEEEAWSRVVVAMQRCEWVCEMLRSKAQQHLLLGWPRKPEEESVKGDLFSWLGESDDASC